MALKADTLAQLSFKDIGQNDILQGEGLAGLVTVAYKRTVNGVQYVFRTTDTTYKRLRALNGASLSVAKAFGAITAKGILELGPRKSIGADLTGKWTYENGRSLELKGIWSERTGATVFALTAQPHANVKVKNTINSKSQAVVSDADLRYKGFTVSPAVQWKSGEKGVAVSHKFKEGTLKGSYALNRQVAGLEFNRKPYKIALASQIGGPKAYKPTLTIGFDKEFDLSRVKDKALGRSDRKASSRVPDVSRIPLDAKLKELDAVYEPRLKRAQAKKEAKEKAFA